MTDMAVVNDCMAGRRIAEVGASDDKANFGNTIYRALRDHGYDVVATNRTAPRVAGDTCYTDLGSIAVRSTVTTPDSSGG